MANNNKVTNTPASVPSEEDIFYKWLQDNIFQINTGYAKNKLVDSKVIVAEVKKANLNLSYLKKQYWAGQKPALDVGAIEAALVNLAKSRGIQSSYYEDPAKNNYYGASGTLYYSCQLPGETEREYQKRHDKLLAKKAARREATLQVSELVLKESNVTTLTAEAHVLEQKYYLANSAFKREILNLSEVFKLQARKNKADVEGIWQSKEVEAAKAKLETARKSLADVKKELDTKRHELTLLKRNLKKPVRGMVKNPQVMNL